MHIGTCIGISSSPYPLVCREEIAYLMDCADTNKDGLLDYTEFTERFHQPAENIGTLHKYVQYIAMYMYVHTYSNTLLCMCILCYVYMYIHCYVCTYSKVCYACTYMLQCPDRTA